MFATKGHKAHLYLYNSQDKQIFFLWIILFNDLWKCIPYEIYKYTLTMTICKLIACIIFASILELRCWQLASIVEFRHWHFGFHSGIQTLTLFLLPYWNSESDISFTSTVEFGPWHYFYFYSGIQTPTLFLLP